MRTVKDVLKSLALLIVVVAAGYFLLRPTDRELSEGWTVPDMFSGENAFAKYDESKTTLAEDRATSFAWLSSGPVMTLENSICKISNPPFNLAAWVMTRIVDERLPTMSNIFLQGLLNMVVVFAIGIVVVVCGYSILWPRQRCCASSPYWDVAFGTCVVAGTMFGLGLLMQIMWHIFFIPFLFFMVGSIAAVASAWNLLRDILRKGVWAIFTIVSIPVGFLGGFFIATALAIALVFIWAAIIVGIAFFLVTRCLHDFAYRTGKKARLSDNTEVEELTDGSWIDEKGKTWRPSGFGMMEREE